MSKILEQLCKDPEERAKFVQLADYFNELDLSDLNEYEDPDDFVRDVLPAHRLLMRIFVKRCLMPLRERKIDLPKEMELVVKEDGAAIGVAGLLVSTEVSSAAQNRMTIPRFHSWLVEGNLTKSKLRLIDMSMNHLLSSDMKYVYDMVEDLRRRNMIAPSGLILDLSCNRVHGIAQFKEEVDRCVASIVNCPSVAFLDLRGNPFSSTDRRYYLKSLTSTSPVASKLIWVDNINLQAHGWRLMVSEDVVNVRR